MRVSIFDVKKEKVVLNTNILLIEPFKNLYEKKNGEKYLAYCFYMTNPYPDENPFAYINERLRKERILDYIGLKKIDHEYEPLVNEVVNILNEMYETPLVRLNKSIKAKIDDIADYLNNTKINDKNMKIILDTIKGYKDISEPYKTSVKNIMEERETKIRGNNMIAYDQ